MATPRPEAKYPGGFDVPNFSVASLSLGLEDKENLFDPPCEKPAESQCDRTDETPKKQVLMSRDPNRVGTEPTRIKKGGIKDNSDDSLQIPVTPLPVDKKAEPTTGKRVARRKNGPPATPKAGGHAAKQNCPPSAPPPTTEQPKLSREQKKLFNSLILEARDLEENGAWIEVLEKYKEAQAIFASDKLQCKITQYEEDLEPVSDSEFVYHKPTERYLLKGGLGVPKKIFQQLFNYQREGVHWLWSVHQNKEVPGGILAVRINMLLLLLYPLFPNTAH